jgi:DNA ligase 1
MNHKPMLAADCGGVETLTFPLVISPKMDGVRAIVSAGGMLSRSLKPIPNGNVQGLFEGLPLNLDGELLAGSPCAKDVYRKTVSMVMSDDAPVDGLVFHVFDIQEDRPWEERHAHLCAILDGLGPEDIEDGGAIALVPQVTVYSLDELLEYEALWVGMGYEGVIARKPGSPYKHGRSTAREGFLLKVKRFVDAEAVVIGVTELMHNGNEAKTNALGRTERSHKKAGMVPTGTMGTLVARDCTTEVVFEIGTGFTAAERAEFFCNSKQVGLTEDKRPIYEAPRSYQGRLAKYKHFPSGAKDKPRHPVFLGWRDSRDI